MNKKDILFYTFLAIFVITAIITFLGILNVVTIREGYLDTLVGVFGVELAGAIIAMFRKVDFFSDTEIPSQNIVTSKIVIPSNSIPASTPIKEQSLQKISDISADQYFSRLDELDHRFAERDEFASQINQNTIKWSGFVNSVSARTNGIMIQLKQINEVGSNLMHLHLPIDCKTRAFALHKGDRLSFEGLLNTTDMIFCPSIDAQNFEILSHNTEPEPKGSDST